MRPSLPLKSEPCRQASSRVPHRLSVRRRRQSRLAAGMLLAPVVMVMPLRFAHPAPAEPRDPEGDVMSVRELMRLETGLALRQARQQARVAEGRGGEAIPVASSGADLELLAIYGVGSKLLAQVRHGGRTLVYLRGNVLPVGAKDAPGAPVFRLLGLSGSCIELGREEVSHTLCLSPSFLRGG